MEDVDLEKVWQAIDDYAVACGDLSISSASFNKIYKHLKDLLEQAIQPPVEGRGPWMQLSSGKAFYPWDPKPEDVDLEDLAIGIAKECRYNGQCNGMYTVAQHSIYVANEVMLVAARQPEAQGRRFQLTLIALMHDAEEGLIKDLRSPLKALVGPRYLEIQRRVRRAINEKLGLQQMVENCTDLLFYIKRADIAVLHAEKRDLMVDAPMPWPTEALGISASIQHIKPVEPVVSYERWMSTFQYLSAAAKEELEQ